MNSFADAVIRRVAMYIVRGTDGLYGVYGVIWDYTGLYGQPSHDLIFVMFAISTKKNILDAPADSAWSIGLSGIPVCSPKAS